MVVLNTLKQLTKHLKKVRDQNYNIGFIPTMGALHPGHISLIHAAQQQQDITVCSIFVNPTQFNDLNDLLKYPRTIEADCKLLEEARCDIVFIPEVSEIYSPEELLLKKNSLEDKSWTEGKTVDFGLLADVMEGAHRPGHFNGVAQVVSKLLKIVRPNKVYFGQKDFQQLAIIRSLVKQLNLPIQIIACPTIREPSGLAMSSRNERLSHKERISAALLSEILFELKDLYLQKTIPELKLFVANKIMTDPMIELEYFEISDAETLQKITHFGLTKSAVACFAIKLGGIRLIDNIVLY